MTTSEQVSFQEAFHLVLGELLSNLTSYSHVLVYEFREVAVVPLLLGCFVCSLQTVRSGLIWSEDTEAIWVTLDDVAGVLTELTSCLRAGPNRDRIP